MPAPTYYAQFTAKQRKAALLEGHRPTTCFLSDAAYSRATSMARQQGTRLPIIIGQLTEIGIAARDGAPIPAPQAPTQPALIGAADIIALTQAILASRFPDETGSARFRQLSFVLLVAAETMRGHPPIARDLARITGAHPDQMSKLSRLLDERGIITRKSLPNYDGRPTAKVLGIAENAVSALDAAHLKATGAPIGGGE